MHKSYIVVACDTVAKGSERFVFKPLYSDTLGQLLAEILNFIFRSGAGEDEAS